MKRERPVCNQGGPDMSDPFTHPSEPAPNRSRRIPEKILTEALDWLRYIVTALAIGMLIVTFVVQNNRVLGSSMVPTLQNGDQLLVEKISPRFGHLSYGDIVTIDGEKLLGEGEPDLVKRLIGLPGDTIDIRGGRVFLNGTPVVESFLDASVQTFPSGMGYDHVVLGDNELYVMGDNRTGSKDSRMFGPFDEDYIIGTCLIRFYPFDRIGTP